MFRTIDDFLGAPFLKLGRKCPSKFVKYAHRDLSKMQSPRKSCCVTNANCWALIAYCFGFSDKVSQKWRKSNLL